MEQDLPQSTEEQISACVQRAVQGCFLAFRDRHLRERMKPQGIINSKRNNPFLAGLGDDLVYYGALVHSLDSSLGQALERLSKDIARLTFGHVLPVVGQLAPIQQQVIDNYIEQYRTGQRAPSLGDYSAIRGVLPIPSDQSTTEECDLYVRDPATGIHAIVQLKFGGNLDTGKAREEKRKAMRALAVVSNHVDQSEPVCIYFATGYNMFGDGSPWRQGSVRRYFAEDELLIGRDYWNMVCRSDDGYALVLQAYQETVDSSRAALDEVRAAYRGNT